MVVRVSCDYCKAITYSIFLISLTAWELAYYPGPPNKSQSQFLYLRYRGIDLLLVGSEWLRT